MAAVDFEAVYKELAGDVFAYFNICFGPDTAEDLTQEVFLRVWREICRSVPPDSWRAWVFRCAVNLKNDFLRRQYAQKNLREQLPQDACSTAACDSTADLAVRLSFEKLEPEQKELLSLKLFGFSSREIGELQGLSASAVRTRLQKARESFAFLLEKENSE